jgi:curved DNA-binding protein CbpA
MYFNACKTLDELKKEYRRVALLHHPDTRHGDTEIMKAVNAEHDAYSKH